VVFSTAIVERAAAIVLLHNHPDRDPSPSKQDRTLTQRLATTGRLLDIGRNCYKRFLEEERL
jgi:DNA repair protein RadC